MRRTSVGLILGMVWGLVACGEQSVDGGSGPAAGAPVKVDLSGSAQKGPFSNGSRVTIAELDANLVQTGRTFATTMNDDGGSYSVRGVQLGTPYARVEVSGYYFDEVRGQLSASPLSLFSYVDLSDRATGNINLLGHLEAARLEHLVTEEQVGFAAAKAQAHREVLRLFEIEPDAVESAEALDISKGGAGNAALFAISVMLQGTRTVAELSELLSNIQTDLSQDGTLDDATNGSAIMGGATTVDLARSRANLAARFAALGVDASVPDITGQVTHFASTAPWEYTGGGIEYPIGGQRPNVLDPGLTRFDFNADSTQLDFAADVPDATELKIRMTNHTAADTASIWFYSGTSGVMWNVSQYDFNNGVQEFKAMRPGMDTLDSFMFGGTGSATVDYFEYGSATPTRTKEITWSGWQGGLGTTARGEAAPPSGAAGGSYGGAGGYGGDGAGGYSGAGSGEGGAAGGPYDPYKPQPYELCGNGVIDAGEDCDGADVRGQTCESFMPGTTGPLRCEPTVCRFDTIECQRACGNGVIDAGEQCDGADLAGQSCESLRPGTSGQLRCAPGACQFDERACEETCGNGVLDAGEECDPGVPPVSPCEHCDPACHLDTLACQ
jgi:hypothetical protein